LSKAVLQNAHMEKAQLARANLNGAFLQGANLSLTNLSEADLLGANLKSAKVNEEQLAKAKNLEGAILPNGSKHLCINLLAVPQECFGSDHSQFYLVQ